LRWMTPPLSNSAGDGPASFDDLVGRTAAITCWALLGWIMLSLAVTAVAAVPGAVGRLADSVAARVVPVALRRAARLALGLTVAAGPVVIATPAVATHPVSRAVATLDAAADPADDLLPAVGRPGWSPTATRVAVAPQSVAPARAEIVVASGDCLWTIAADALGANATNAEIAAEWPRWYSLNRTVVGPDPDLLLPGMVLRAPTAN
jgi:nucleoid-associated protein YgaU